MKVHKYQLTGVMAGMLGLLVGCSGSIDAQNEPGVGVTPGVGPGVTGPEAPPVGPTIDPPPPPGTECGLTSPTRIWRLNDKQYTNTVQDLLPGVTVPSLATPGRDPHEFVSWEHLLPVQEAFASQLQDVAFAVASQVAQGLTPAGNQYVTCTPGQAERDCAQAFIDDFGSRAFRRPLEQAERDELIAVYDVGVQNGSGFASGIELVVGTVLQAPSLMYRTELGAGGAVGQSVRLTAYELGSSLSYLLLNSGPDDELWAVMLDGTIADPAVMRQQVDRLLQLDRVRANLTDVVAGWTGLPHALTVEKTEEDLAGLELTTGMRQSMFDEARSFIDEILWNNGTVADLFTSRQGFVDEAMANFYDIDHPGDGVVQAELPLERTGILGRAGVVTSIHYGVNPEVFRGKLLREKFLCGELPPPPPNVDIDGFNAQYGGLSTRERIAVRAGEASCQGCHAFMDELGIAYDSYGGVGQIVDEVNGVPADPAGQLTGTDVDAPFADLTQLSTLLSGSEFVKECVSEQMLTYALGRLMEKASGAEPRTADQCASQQIAQAINAGGGQLSTLFRELVVTSVFQNRIVGGQ